jgi:hypothetical protein
MLFSAFRDNQATSAWPHPDPATFPAGHASDSLTFPEEIAYNAVARKIISQEGVSPKGTLAGQIC